MTPFKLEPRKIQQGFIVPEGYFDTMRGQVNNQLAETNVISLRRRQWWYSAAAILVIGLGSALYFTNSPSPKLEPAIIENYLVTQSDAQIWVVDALEAEDISALYREYEIDDQLLEEQLIHTNVEQYLIN